MRLKTFTAPTTTLAMAQIRAVLGDEAIIVATREEGGSVRVTAALETVAGAGTGAGGSPGSGEPPRESDFGDAIYDALRRNGIPAEISEPLMALTENFEPTDPATAFAAAIRQHFQFRPLDDTCRRQARMLVGPPGAGKTQTVAKLAARALTLGHRVALFTTDSERTGGDARLAGLAGALGLPLMTAGEPDTLAAGLVGVDGYDLVLIDSAGVNHLDVDEMESLSRYLLCGDIEAILVVPAGIDPIEAGDMAQMFSELGVGRLISTRHDMTRRMGSSVTAAHAAKLTFAAFSNTARIKDGLIPADPSVLARIILHGGGAAQQRKAGA